ncbi:MAG: zinc ribbon domain-containing protein [Blastocatellia bacterium]|nr:zinc ribbon domain-containing protein [Blastocatellia bacterium]
MNIAEQQSVATCQICFWLIKADQSVQHCSSCQSPYHQECWDWLGGCATYGCPNMVESKKAEDEPATYWGATEKKCPLCAETIPISEKVCPYCKKSFDDIRPMTREDLLPKKEDPALAAYRKGAIWLFVFSLIGCTSPIALIAGSIWYKNNRDDIERAGATTKALIFIALGICVLYIVVMGFAILLWNVVE